LAEKLCSLLIERPEEWQKCDGHQLRWVLIRKTG